MKIGEMSSMFKSCTNCGANLDPGEKCDCDKEDESGMKIIKLMLENFQGIKNKTINFDGKCTNIYGDNGTGKTTIYNAVTWLLFDKASTGAKNFNPKTKGDDGADIHYLLHKAEGTFRLNNGQIITFSKALSEKWQKKRGSNMESFNGHTTEYHIDDVPVQQQEYDGRIAEVCPPERAKILTMTSYFPEELHWEERRKILLDICGDIKDDDVINSNLELKELTVYLIKQGTTDQYYTVDEALKITSAQKSEINKELELIPARIDEAVKALPDLDGIDESWIDNEVQVINEEIEELEQKRFDLNNGQAAQDLRRELAEQNTVLAETKTQHIISENSKNDDGQIKVLNIKIDEAESLLRSLKVDMHNLRDDIVSKTSQRDGLVSEYKILFKKQWEGIEKCYACGQSLPEHEIIAAQKNFNNDKSTKLQNIRAEIEENCSKQMISNLNSKLDKTGQRISEQEEYITSLYSELAAEKSKLVDTVAFEATEEYAKIKAKIDEIKSTISKTDNGLNEKKYVIDGDISKLRAKVNVFLADKTKITFAETQQKRINDLKKQEKELSAQYEQLQYSTYLCEQFIKTKVSMLTEKINNKFNKVRFRLFIEQINGGLKEDCEVLIPCREGLVPYDKANNAARINAGVEIINVLSKHWDTSMPLFIDNRESVVKLADTDTQVISLIVSESDETLRVESA